MGRGTHSISHTEERHLRCQSELQLCRHLTRGTSESSRHAIGAYMAKARHLRRTPRCDQRLPQRACTRLQVQVQGAAADRLMGPASTVVGALTRCLEEERVSDIVYSAIVSLETVFTILGAAATSLPMWILARVTAAVENMRLGKAVCQQVGSPEACCLLVRLHGNMLVGCPDHMSQ